MDTATIEPRTMDTPSLSAFAWVDPLLLEEQITGDERLIRGTARAFAQEKLQPRLIRDFAEERSDASIFREMGKLGLLTGGPGCNVRAVRL